MAALGQDRPACGKHALQGTLDRQQPNFPPLRLCVFAAGDDRSQSWVFPVVQARSLSFGQEVPQRITAKDHCLILLPYIVRKGPPFFPKQVSPDRRHHDQTTLVCVGWPLERRPSRTYRAIPHRHQGRPQTLQPKPKSALLAKQCLQ